MQIYLPIADIPVNVFLVLAMGLAVGFISGMFGIGGGFLMTPLLIFIGVQPAVAVASAHDSHVAAASFSGATAYRRRNAIDATLALTLLAGGIFGSAGGVALFTWLRALNELDLVIGLSYVILLGIVGVLMVGESARAIVRSIQGKRVELRRPGSHMWIHGLPLKLRFKRSKIYVSAIPVLAIKFIIGFLGAIMGIGGGFLLVPMLILSAAGADGDRHRHVNGLNVSRRGGGDHSARGNQSPGRCRARADPHGGWRHWRAVRRALPDSAFAASGCGCCSACSSSSVGLRFAGQLVLQPDDPYSIRVIGGAP